MASCDVIRRLISDRRVWAWHVCAHAPCKEPASVTYFCLATTCH